MPRPYSHTYSSRRSATLRRVATGAVICLCALWAFAACDVLPAVLSGQSLSLGAASGAATASAGALATAAASETQAAYDALPQAELSKSDLTLLPAITAPAKPVSPLILSVEQPANQPTATPTRLPSQTSDLLYIAGGNLMRWDHITGYASALVEEVSAYSASASGKEIILLRPRNISANGMEVFDLDLLDLETQRIDTLAAHIPRLYSMAISPDGKWVAYTLKVTNADEISSIPTPQEPLTGTGSADAVVYAIHVSAPAKRVNLGLCIQENTDDCTQLTWSPDSRSLLWIGKHGIWVSSPEKPAARLARANLIQVSDPKGQITEVNVAFSAPVWSPAGRYILINILPSLTGVRWQAVVDTRTGRLGDVPDAAELVRSEAAIKKVSVSWLADGSLIVAHGGDPAQQRAPFLQTWRILPTNGKLLVSERLIELRSSDLLLPLPADTTTAANTEVSYCLDWLTALDENRLAMGIAIQGAHTAPLLFTLDLQSSKLQMLAELPADTIEVLWSPDGSGALAIGQDNQVQFVTLNGELHDLYTMLGSDAHDFTWLSPASRSLLR